MELFGLLFGAAFWVFVFWIIIDSDKPYTTKNGCGCITYTHYRDGRTHASRDMRRSITQCPECSAKFDNIMRSKP